MSWIHDFHRCGLAQLFQINFRRWLSIINSFKILLKKCGDMVVPTNSPLCIHLTNIFLRPVHLDMHICHIDTELVAETPFHSLLWLFSRSGKRFLWLEFLPLSSHCVRKNCSHLWWTVSASVVGVAEGYTTILLQCAGHWPPKPHLQNFLLS